MIPDFKSIKEKQTQLNKQYKPILLRLVNAEDKLAFENLFAEQKILFIHDEIDTQLKDLIKCQNPSKRLGEEDYERLITEHLNGADKFEFGVWAFYPWSGRLVHILDELDFIEVRTNRNQYKITREERDSLGKKRIGIIGLSVGQSIALTVAMERSCGELRLADFDDLELSNLNRIRSGAQNLGVNKVVIAAREIAEIDPYIKIVPFFDGLTTDNIDDFFLKDGKLDVLVDECDGLDMKILARYKARDLKIPVVMDTSDRGMLDIERFDLEPNRELLHGTAQGLNPDNIKELSNEDKVPIILQMLGAENISSRGKASMVEVQQSISTWPQLASSITLGGGVAADVCRRILLQQNLDSGRYYIDLDTLIPDIDREKHLPEVAINPFKPLEKEQLEGLVNNYSYTSDIVGVNLEEKTVEYLVSQAILAPSTGNDQPWKWLYKNGVLFLFHDEYRSFSFGDFQKNASYITFGATFENLYLTALKEGLLVHYQFHPISGEENVVAAITFSELKQPANNDLIKLTTAIPKRNTNRNPSKREVIDTAVLNSLKRMTESVGGARLRFFIEETELKQFAKFIGICDRIRLLNKDGHQDFVNREMRWTESHAVESKDGIDVRTLGLGNSQLAALGMIKSGEVIQTIKNIKGGKAFDALALRNVMTASALALITVPKYQLQSFFEGGRAMERFWLQATLQGFAVYPLISPLYLFSRVIHGNGAGLDKEDFEELAILRKEFCNLTGLNNTDSEVFLVKLATAPQPEIASLRLPTEEVLFFN